MKTTAKKDDKIHQRKRTKAIERLERLLAESKHHILQAIKAMLVIEYRAIPFFEEHFPEDHRLTQITEKFARYRNVLGELLENDNIAEVLQVFEGQIEKVTLPEDIRGKVNIYDKKKRGIK